MTRASGTADEVQPDPPEWGSSYLMLQRKWKQNKAVATEISAHSDWSEEMENYHSLQIRYLMCLSFSQEFMRHMLEHSDCCQMVSVRNLLHSNHQKHRVPILLRSCCTVPLDLRTMQGYDPAGQHWAPSPWIYFFFHTLCHGKELRSSEQQPVLSTKRFNWNWETDLFLKHSPTEFMSQGAGNSNVMIWLQGSLMPSENYYNKLLSSVTPLKSMLNVAQRFCLAVSRFRKVALQPSVFRKVRAKAFFWLKSKFKFWKAKGSSKNQQRI